MSSHKPWWNDLIKTVFLAVSYFDTMELTFLDDNEHVAVEAHVERQMPHFTNNKSYTKLSESRNLRIPWKYVELSPQSHDAGPLCLLCWGLSERTLCTLSPFQ